MAASLQARLNRLGLGMAKPAAPPSHGPQPIPRWRQELADYKQRQEEMSKPPALAHDAEQGSSADEDDCVRAHASSKPKRKKTTATHSSTVRSEGGHILGVDPDKVLFLPKGACKGGLAETEIEDDEYEMDEEPESSSVDLVGTFCLFSQVIKFPYRYMQDPENKVSQRFFAGGMAFEREWKLYYINPPEDMGQKPVFLVPHDQVEKLTTEISTEFQANIEVPGYPFTMSFFNDGTPKPQLLGHVNSKDDFDDFKSSVPENPLSYAVVSSRATKIQELDHAAWREKVERALAAEQKKKGATKRKKRERQTNIIMENYDQLKRTQRYLGLRSPLPTTQIIRPESAEPGHQLQQMKDVGLLPDALDANKVAEFPFEDQTVIIAFDVESWEENHAMVTEIGISTLDTAELVNIPPGHQGENWIEKIRSRHIRIAGRENMRNYKYCTGNPDSFQFGTSEFVAIDSAPDLVDSCFEWPYSAGFKCEGPPLVDTEGNPIPRPLPVLNATQAASDDRNPRNLLLIGHDITGDIAYLSRLGSEIFGPGTKHPPTNSDGTISRRQRVLRSVRERLDTSVLHKTLNKDDQVRSLIKMCHDLDITAWYAHNAGNDARYTLEAFIKLAIKARQQDDAANKLARKSGSFDVHATLWELEKEMRVQAKIDSTRNKIEEHLSTWEKGGAPGCNPHRSPSPLFANQERDSGKITLEEANRRYLEKAMAPLSSQTEARFDDTWKPMPCTEASAGTRENQASSMTADEVEVIREETAGAARDGGYPSNSVEQVVNEEIDAIIINSIKN